MLLLMRIDMSKLRSIPGYEGKYSASPDGQIISWARGYAHVLKPHLNTTGYLIVTPHCKTKPVHRLVAAAFFGPCPEGLQVNHKDGNKTNNAASNLEYVTPSENMLHAHRVLNAFANRKKPVYRKPPDQTKYCRGMAQRNARLTDDDVREIRALSASGMSQHAIAALYPVNRTQIQKIIKRQRWSHVL